MIFQIALKTAISQYMLTTLVLLPGLNDVKDIETKVIPDLIKICDWLKANKLSLNALKPELILLGTTRNKKARQSSSN